MHEKLMEFNGQPQLKLIVSQINCKSDKLLKLSFSFKSHHSGF